MTDYYLQKLTAAVAVRGHHLAVTFADGFTATIELLPWIERAPLRQPLRDETQFSAVVVNEFGAPEWPDEIDLSPGTLRAWCEAGCVMTMEETNAWIENHSRPTQEVA